MALKRCIECNLDKEPTADFFSKNNKYSDGLQPRCTVCHKIYCKFMRDKAPKKEANTDATVMKVCIVCGEQKSAIRENFHRHGKMPDGLQKKCISCALEWSKVYYKEYPAPPSRTSEYLTEVSRVRRSDPELKANDTARNAERYVEIRTRVLTHYANGDLCCNCCGVRNYKFLTLDHINGGGNKHRKEIGVTGGFDYWYWFIKNDFPEGFQVLCYNCNCSKGFHGVCPHNNLDDSDFIVRTTS